MASKKSFRQIVFIITAAISLLIALLFMFASFYIKNEEAPTNTAEVTSIRGENTVSSSISEYSVNDVSEHSADASQVFAESLDDSNDNSEVSTTVKETPHGWVINNLGYTYVYGNSAFEQFNYKSTALERYVTSLNNLAVTLPEDIKLFNITVPVSGSFVNIPRDIYVGDNFFNSSQSTFVSTVASKLDERIINVPIVSLLEQQYDNGEYVFFRTDKNWTALAAYTAYTEFCKSADIAPIALEHFKLNEASEYLGSFYNAISLEDGNQNYDFINSLYDNPDKLVYYSTISDLKTSLTIYERGNVYENYTLCGNNVSKSNAYNVFLGKTAERYEIITNADGGNLLIIGDSSVYPIIPFLASHYRKIDIINPSLYNKTIDDFIEGREYDHAIAMCYSTNAVSGEYIPSLNVFTGVISDG